MAERVVDFYSEHDGIKCEPITRCKHCRWAHEAPPVEEWHIECRVHPLNMHYTPDMGFCHLGEPKEDA